MDRLTVQDVRVDEHTIRRAFVDAEAVRDRAMEFYWRLKDYEDTGLLPDEILPKEKADEIALSLMRLADLESFAPYDRLRELAESDKDGRVVVLPYGIGQRVFARLDTDEYVSECEVVHISISNKASYAVIEPIGARGREYGVSLNGFGKTVFLTREEAEQVLRKEVTE